MLLSPWFITQGALRTSFLAYATLTYTLIQSGVNYRKNNRNAFIKESAAENFERAFFRPAQDDANYDFLRSLHVSDSLPLPVFPPRLVLCPVRVFTGRRARIADCGRGGSKRRDL